MKFAELYNVFYTQMWFDVAMVKLFFPLETEQGIRTSLYRFTKEEKIVSLRRGMYCFSPLWNKTPLTGQAIASVLYSPSYLSERWALSWYGIIPEKTIMYTSISTRVTRSFENSLGNFRYRTVQKKLFFGFTQENLNSGNFLIASPEKALLDLWYLEEGQWSIDRFESWRFTPNRINNKKLLDLAKQFQHKKVQDATHLWLEFSENYDEGVEIL